MARILVVDEDELIRTSLRRLLALEGHEVVEAVGGLPAIELALADPPDLLLCDLLMPDLDGLQVARQLRLDPRTAHVPIAILTGSVALPLEDTVAARYVDAFMTKPYERRRLLSVIAQLLGRR
jgi:CheY-like chemotaxis protein